MANLFMAVTLGNNEDTGLLMALNYRGHAGWTKSQDTRGRRGCVLKPLEFGTPLFTSTMYAFTKPDDAAVAALLDRQRTLPFSYANPGLTRAFSATDKNAPAGFDLDHCRLQLGRGGDTFAAACRAIRQWRMFDIGWVELCPEATPIEVDAVVGVLARPCGLWSLNACRIVYVIDEPPAKGAAPCRFGFAYGTLPDHVERGEERFTVEWCEDDTVWYDLLAVSRPGDWLTRAAYPLVRRWQGAFRRDSSAAMLRAVTQFSDAQSATGASG